jgi:hypothetical protein
MISETERRGNAFDDAGLGAVDRADGAGRQDDRKSLRGPDPDGATNKSHGLAGINDSVAENGFDSESVRKDGVLSLQPSCGSLFRAPVNTNQPFTNRKRRKDDESGE